MTDDKAKKGAQDRNRVARSEGYEVEYFARKQGITTEQAQDLIKRHGSNRAVLDAEAEKLKARAH